MARREHMNEFVAAIIQCQGACLPQYSQVYVYMQFAVSQVLKLVKY